MKWGSFVGIILAASVSTGALAQESGDPDPIPEDNPSVQGPADYGSVPSPTGVQQGRRPYKTQGGGPNAQVDTFAALAPAGGIPASGSPTAGVFAPSLQWPIIPIHIMVLPDGRVLSYGTDASGAQGAQMIYDVWDPASGSHLTLPNKIGTDIFCSGLTLIPASGEALLVGGDKTINGARNFSVADTSIFRPVTNVLRSVQKMAYPRWYATVLDLAGGKQLALGGRQSPGVAATTPEIFSASTGWTQLAGATSDPAFGIGYAAWSYPRAWVAPSGKVFILENNGDMFYMDTANGGTVTQLPGTTQTATTALPAIMFAPGKILALRNPSWSFVIDLNGAAPVATKSGGLDQVRFWSTLTDLPDGHVLVSGGSTVANALTGVAYTVQNWNPSTGVWTTGATYTKARLYHSEALLLPDGSVLVGGGGADGPVHNLNVEIYYPGYLYNPDGSPAARPTITSAPTQVALTTGTFGLGVGAADTISRVTLVRLGAMTHAFDGNQRAAEATFTQDGQSLNVTLPSKNGNQIVRGYWYVFVINAAGVPSVANIIRIS